MGLRILSTLWGFAEATLFFLVPDILLSDRAVVSLKSGMMACHFALAGALVGGMLMYGWGLHHPGGAMAALEKVPAINPAMVDRVESDIRSRGLWAVPLGSITGKPYKIYAVQAARLDIGLLPFLLVSVPARLARFIAVTLLVSGLSSAMSGRWSLGRRRGVMLGAWVAFYLLFFIKMGL